MNKYLVIKLPGNWIDREQIKQRVKMMLGVEVLDECSVVTYSGTQAVSAVRTRNDKDYMEYTKRIIASSIGQNLAADGLIHFREGQRNDYAVSVIGEVTVIKETDDE